MFSIVIPTWNNLAYLELCVRSIRQNSKFVHQIIVHVNDGSDGTLDWVEAQNTAHGLDFTASPLNIGICYAVNGAAALARHDYIVYMNDDMVCAPNWDDSLVNRIKALDTNAFMISGTMIQPRDTNNTCTVVHNFGDTAIGFDIQSFNRLSPCMGIKDWSGSTWPPTVVHRDWWHKVGGYSIEFSPGMSSDNDFAMKMWTAGCRIFWGVGDSLVYHFMQKSTGKVIKNNGSAQFLRKWGITASTFDAYYAKLGQPLDTANPKLALNESRALAYQRIRSRLKRVFV
jgi:GT2 family glycosyltransferase